MTVKELVNSCDMNCNIEFYSKKLGLLFGYKAGDFHMARIDEKLVPNDYKNERELRNYLIFVGLAGQEVKDFYITSVSGHAFPIIKITI